jgi:hypothetical protein
VVLEYVAALVIIGHGIGHTTGFIESWTSVKSGFHDEPWLFDSRTRLRSPVGRAFGLVWLVLVPVFIIAGIGILLGDTWWRETAIAGSVLSAVVMLPWWRAMIGGAKAGLLLDFAIIIVLLVPGGSQITDFFGVP